MEDSEHDQLTPELELAVGEQLVLTSFRLAMMDADIDAEDRQEKSDLKRRDRDAEVARAIGLIKALPANAPQWALDFREVTDVHRRDNVYDGLRMAAQAFGVQIQERPRALMVLIDAVIYNPWSQDARWHNDVHQRQLESVAQCLPALRPRDLATVQQEYAASLRRLRRRSAKLGLDTSGAWAKLPHPVSAALQSAASWVTSFHVDVVDAAIRAEVMTRLVVIEAEHDGEKAKRVVQSIQERLAVVAAKQEELVAKIRDLRNANVVLEADNRELRRQLLHERRRAQLSEQALKAALDHIFDAPLALSPARTGRDER